MRASRRGPFGADQDKERNLNSTGSNALEGLRVLEISAAGNWAASLLGMRFFRDWLEHMIADRRLDWFNRTYDLSLIHI